MTRGLGLFIALAAFVLATFTNSSRAVAQDFEGPSQEYCISKIDRVDEVHSESDALACGSFLFFFAGYERPGNFYENPLAFTKRAIELNPYRSSSYHLVFWYHLNRWTKFRAEPADYAKYRGELATALAWSKSTAQKFWKNPYVLQQISRELAPIATYHDLNSIQIILEIGERLEALTPNPQMIVNFRLRLGHIYRKRGLRDLAVVAYERAQEIDPANKVAARYLRELEGNGKLYLTGSTN